MSDKDRFTTGESLTDGVIAGSLFVCFWIASLMTGWIIGIGPLGGILGSIVGVSVLFWWLML